jgi:hypothetical protein
MHSTYTHWGWVDSQLLVVGSQIANLTPDPSFCHNSCFRCSKGLCEAIFNIYTSITFQWYEERLKARCFDPYNWALKFQESRRTPKSPFQECECHPHTLPKVGLQKWGPCTTCSWKVGPFWGLTDLLFVSSIILVAWDVITCLVIYFSMCGVWLSTIIIQHTNTPTIALTNYGARLLMELGFWCPIEFDTST